MYENGYRRATNRNISFLDSEEESLVILQIMTDHELVFTQTTLNVLHSSPRLAHWGKTAANHLKKKGILTCEIISSRELVMKSCV